MNDYIKQLDILSEDVKLLQIELAQINKAFTTCIRKRQYNHLHHAADIAKRMDGIAYQCEYCCSYHITTQKETL